MTTVKNRRFAAKPHDGSRPEPPTNGGISIAAARRIAIRAHTGQVDANGDPYISHVARVAAGVPLFAQPVAWLHDALEPANVDESALVDAGASADECHAIRLLSRDPTEASDSAYLAQVRAIALSEGRAGEIARAVKRADLFDHLSHPLEHQNGWTPPYAAAFVVLTVVKNQAAT